MHHPPIKVNNIQTCCIWPAFLMILKYTEERHCMERNIYSVFVKAKNRVMLNHIKKYLFLALYLHEKWVGIDYQKVELTFMDHFDIFVQK